MVECAAGDGYSTERGRAIRRIVEPVLVGAERDFSRTDDDCRYVLDLGLLREENGALATTLAGKLKVVKNYRGGRATVSSAAATDMEGFTTFTVTLEPSGLAVIIR